jgi:hypothetical protein
MVAQPLVLFGRHGREGAQSMLLNRETALLAFQDLPVAPFGETDLRAVLPPSASAPCYRRNHKGQHKRP